MGCVLRITHYWAVSGITQYWAVSGITQYWAVCFLFFSQELVLGCVSGITQYWSVSRIYVGLFQKITQYWAIFQELLNIGLGFWGFSVDLRIRDHDQYRGVGF